MDSVLTPEDSVGCAGNYDFIDCVLESSVWSSVFVDDDTFDPNALASGFAGNRWSGTPEASPYGSQLLLGFGRHSE